MKVGIGISSRGSPDDMVETLTAIHATSKPDVVVVDNVVSVSNHPKFVEKIRQNFCNFIWLINHYGDAATSKNRLLFRLFAIERCDVVILIEPGVVPFAYNWLLQWKMTAAAYGVINMRTDEMQAPISGEGLPRSAWLCRDVSGHVMGITSAVWRRFGYMAPDVSCNRNESLIYTRRTAIDNNGGWVCEDTEEYRFVCLSQKMFVIDQNKKLTNYEKVDNQFSETDPSGYVKGWKKFKNFVPTCMGEEW